MVDINKYLENQIALAKQKSDSINSGDNIAISQRSKAAADKISNKQIKNNSKCCPKDILSTISITEAEKPSTSTKKHDDDYYDFRLYGDRVINTFTPDSVSRLNYTGKKIVDDGDKKFYTERLNNWRNNLAQVNAKKFQGVPSSADIQYALDDNKDTNEKHKLLDGLRLPMYIWKQLYKFQRTGVKWLWELHQAKAGGMLGDEMGLGKTIQIIAFLAGLSKTDSGLWRGLGPSIIVAPATVIYQWVSHFHFWIPELRVAVLHHTGSHSGSHNKLIRNMYESNGVLLITYAGIIKYHKDLISRKWHYLILDEGHKIKNPATQVTKIVKKFQTPHRLLITGSPMQNTLQEMWSLFDFMKPGLLGKYSVFMEYFAEPITQGGYANASEIQEAIALETAKVLKQIITPYMLRRTKLEVQKHIKLPKKNEQVLFCALSEEQKDLYLGYLMSDAVKSYLPQRYKYRAPMKARILVALSTLRKICNHPDLYLHEAQVDSNRNHGEIFGYWKKSGKMTVVNSLLKIWLNQGHRALIFSQSKAMLCILEQYLQNQDFKYIKMDGTVNIGQRQNLIKTFNENLDYFIFLSTTRVGGLGVNLTGADRVIIYDPDWNPATDDQAKERSWRIGQEKNVTVYRLISAGTVEEKMYRRQIFKQLLSNKILIDPNQKNVLTTSKLQDLFTLEDLNYEGDTETASLFQHTKVDLSNNKSKDKNQLNHLDVYTSPSENKKNAMKTIVKYNKETLKCGMKFKEDEVNKCSPNENKGKQKSSLNPVKSDMAEIYLVDSVLSNNGLENIESELDLISMYTKNGYEEKIINDVLKRQGKDPEEKEQLGDELKMINHGRNNKLITTCPNKESFQRLTKADEDYKKKNKKERKRKHSMSDLEVDLVATRKVKKSKHKREKEKKDKDDDDDYVLSKLFAKSAVKNVLHHDVIVGLAEKEKRHRLKEEAAAKAQASLTAIKISVKTL